MKKILIVVVVLFATLLIINSCDDRDNILKNDEIANSPQLQSNGNPYEYIGINHNILLDSMLNYIKDDYGYLMENYDFDVFPIGHLHTDSVIISYIVKAYIESSINPSITYQQALNESVPVFNSISEANTNLQNPIIFANTINSYIDSLPQIDQYYLDSLNRILANAGLNILAGIDEDYNFNSLESLIYQLEITILNDTNITNNPSQHVCLKHITLAKYSFEYLKNNIIPESKIKINKDLSPEFFGMTARGK